MEKHFGGYIILNWKDGSIRAVKRKPKVDALALSDIPIVLDLTIRIPEQQELALKGEVTLSQAQVENVMLDALEE